MRRRTFLGSSLALGAAAAGGGLAAACAPTSPSSGLGSTLGPPETTTIRIAPVFCDPALWMAGDYLKEEGFTEVHLVPPSLNSLGAVPKGEADVGILYSQQIITNVDAGIPIVALAGLHTGCGEVWTRPGISSIGELKGKTIAVRSVDAVNDAWYSFWAAMLGNIGIDPRKDVNFVEASSPLDTFLDGRSDAILVLALEVPLLRASPKNTGSVLINTLEDAPWRQYYCCQLIANRDWARRYPVATKRVTRALLRANDLVTKDPAAAASAGVAQGMVAAASYDFERAVLKNSSHEWRDIDPASTLLFFAAQLAGQKLIKGGPQQLVTQASGFDLSELKRQYPRAN